MFACVRVCGLFVVGRTLSLATYFTEDSRTKCHRIRNLYSGGIKPSLQKHVNFHCQGQKTSKFSACGGQILNDNAEMNIGEFLSAVVCIEQESRKEDLWVQRVKCDALRAPPPPPPLGERGRDALRRTKSPKFSQLRTRLKNNRVRNSNFWEPTSQKVHFLMIFQYTLLKTAKQVSDRLFFDPGGAIFGPFHCEEQNGRLGSESAGCEFSSGTIKTDRPRPPQGGSKSVGRPRGAGRGGGGKKAFLGSIFQR